MAENFIFIDRNTSFNGTITAGKVIVAGVVQGDITASEKVLVKSGARITGDIVTDQLLFEEGGKHNGMIRLGQPSEEDYELEKEPETFLSEENNKKTIVDGSKEKKNSQRLW